MAGSRSATLAGRGQQTCHESKRCVLTAARKRVGRRKGGKGEEGLRECSELEGKGHDDCGSRSALLEGKKEGRPQRLMSDVT